jgi:hypothetical protein
MLHVPKLPFYLTLPLPLPNINTTISAIPIAHGTNHGPKDAEDQEEDDKEGSAQVPRTSRPITRASFPAFVRHNLLSFLDL